MFKAIGKLFSANPKPTPVDSTDSVLGALRWSKDDEMWEAQTKVGEESIGFFIAGDTSPSAALVAHAREIVAKLPDFRGEVASFLSDEVKEQKHLARFAGEIGKLAIEHVCLMWPERPDDGMIYFAGPDEDRCWRCDYVGRKPKGLGFDD
jgi:hypothetical protein